VNLKAIKHRRASTPDAKTFLFAHNVAKDRLFLLDVFARRAMSMVQQALSGKFTYLPARTSAL
jgi:hypothetical protein